MKVEIVSKGYAKDVKVKRAMIRVSEVQGTVEVEATIGPDGKVIDAKVAGSKPGDAAMHRALEAAAVETVKQRVFEPVPNGPTTRTVTLTLTLRDSSKLPRKKER